MPALPTGTVTFLFTDIEGSTRLVQQASRVCAHRKTLDDLNRGNWPDSNQMGPK